VARFDRVPDLDEMKARFTEYLDEVKERRKKMGLD
jgi:hypothetical protein